MKNSSQQLTTLICATLVVMQTAFMVIPTDTIRLYNMALRPLVYAVLAVAAYVFMGLNQHPVRKAHSANMAAALSVVMFGIVFLATAFLFGAGANIMTANLPVVMNSLWVHGVVIVLGELIRYKLIKTANPQKRTGIALILTIVLAYCQMDALRMLIHGDVMVSAFFFESFFRALVISAVASYLAIEGSFLSVILVSFTYRMATYLVPIMPDVAPLMWTLIICGLLFVTAIIYHFITNEKKRDQRVREKRAARYAKKPVLANVITAAAISVIVAFFVGAFPIYPVVVLSNSMADTFDRGSIVFVERVPHGEAFIRVGEGYVIHFHSHTGLEYIHRVVDFRHDIHGEREYITRGDASYLVDPFPVPQDDVLGIARAQIPFIGYPYIFFQAIFRAFS